METSRPGGTPENSPVIHRWGPLYYLRKKRTTKKLSKTVSKFFTLLKSRNQPEIHQFQEISQYGGKFSDTLKNATKRL